MFFRVFLRQVLHALLTLMISDCPRQLAKLCWNTVAKRCASSPCTNHPVRCPPCTKTFWSYYMARLYADVHDTAQHPHLMHIAEAEQEAVLNWVPHTVIRQRKKIKAILLQRLMDG